MKAVIPVAGAGTRLRPHTYTQPKPLLPVAGKPIIAFLIDDLRAAGVHDFVFIIGYLGEKIRGFIHENYPDLNVEFVEQNEREGLGHAIWTARNLLEKEPEILIVLGDTITDLDLKKIIKTKNSCLAVKEVKDPRDFGVAELGLDGKVMRVVEKPRIPKSNLALVGVYKIKEVNTLLDELEKNIFENQRSHGEFQLTDALMQMIQKNIQFDIERVNQWFDCGKKEVLLDTNRILLDKIIYNAADEPAFDNTIIVHPVSIGKNCQITDSIIGPHVTIGDGAVIERSLLRNSIIGAFAQLSNTALFHSIIGNDTSVFGIQKSLNIGDNTELEL
ncbi:MAG: hypothetical protein RL757_2791 [Bacteroidota bacterium]|jgi:glucose-1-phosphate thymidylyltransferase